MKMLWFSDKPKHLPLASGPFVPGCTDIMLDYDKNGLFIRLFYPTNSNNITEENCRKWIPWIPDYAYVIGISKLIKISLYVLRFVFWWYGDFHIPVLYREKIKTDKNMKCVIVSHGLGGSRFLYSTIANDLASHGFLVACIEHRENSACYTYYYKNKQNAANNEKTMIEFQHIPFGKHHYEKRNAQIKVRSAECEKVIQFFKNLNGGNVPNNVLDDVEVKEGDDGFCLDDLIGNIDVDNFTLMGHSFGAATVLYTLPRIKEIRQTILLDPWMFPIKEENLHQSIDIPLLFINTQTFHIESNVKAMAKFKTEKNKMYTIRQSTHENQTDSVLISRYWLNMLMSKIDPREALKINNALIFKFLHDNVGTPSDVEKYEVYLSESSHHLEEGLTKPWQ